MTSLSYKRTIKVTWISDLYSGLLGLFCLLPNKNFISDSSDLYLYFSPDSPDLHAAQQLSCNHGLPGLVFENYKTACK